MPENPTTPPPENEYIPPEGPPPRKYGELSTEDLQTKYDTYAEKLKNLKSPSYGSYVSEYGQEQVNEGLDFYLKGFPGYYYGTRFASEESNWNPQGEELQHTTDLKGISSTAQAGDIWNDRGLVRVDPATLTGENKYYNVDEDGEAWGYKDEEILDFINDKVTKTPLPVRSQFDNQSEFDKSINEWHDAQNRSWDIMSFIEKKEIGDVISTYIPTAKKVVNPNAETLAEHNKGLPGNNDVRQLKYGVDGRGIYRDGIELSDKMNNAGRSVKLYAGHGEKSNTSLPLAIGQGDVGYCGDNMTCISGATGIQTLASRAEGGEGYNNWLKEHNYDPYPGQIQGNIYSSGGDFIAANDRAWGGRNYGKTGASYGLVQDKNWDVREVNVTNDTEIVGHKEDGTPIYAWKEGMQPGLGNIIGVSGTVDYSTGKGEIHHSGVIYKNNGLVADNMVGDDGEDNWVPRWEAGSLQDHTTGRTYSADSPFAHGEYDANSNQRAVVANYVGPKEYQEWLAKQNQKYTMHKNFFTTTSKELKDEIDWRANNPKKKAEVEAPSLYEQMKNAVEGAGSAFYEMFD